MPYCAVMTWKMFFFPASGCEAYRPPAALQNKCRFFLSRDIPLRFFSKQIFSPPVRRTFRIFKKHNNGLTIYQIRNFRPLICFGFSFAPNEIFLNFCRAKAIRLNLVFTANLEMLTFLHLSMTDQFNRAVCFDISAFSYFLKLHFLDSTGFLPILLVIPVVN